MSDEGMRKSMIVGGVLMKGMLRISLVLYPLVCIETPASALNCEFDRKTAACLLDIVPSPRSHKPFTFQLQLKSKEFFGIRKEVDPLTGATREYLEQGGPSSPSIWDPVFEIVDWEVWARTPTGFLPVTSGTGSSGTVTVTHGGSFILHVRTKLTGVEKRHVRLPDGGAGEIEVPTEVLFGTEHHEFQVAAWCVDATVNNIEAPLDAEGNFSVWPIGVPAPSPNSHLVKIKVGGPPPPVPAQVVFYVEEEGGGHESGHHTPFRPTGTLSGKMVQIVAYPPTGPTVYRAGQFGGAGRVSIAISEEALPAATGPTLPEQYAHRDAIIDAGSQIADRGKWCEMGSVEFTVGVEDLQPLGSSPSGDYKLVGGTCQHHGPTHPDRTDVPAECQSPDNNHFGTTNTLQKLTFLATKWSNYISGKAGLDIIQYNDISLPNGGGFDVNGRWKIDLDAINHAGHRKGDSADVRSDPSHGDGVPRDGPHAKEFRRIVEKELHGQAKKHGTSSGRHWHLDF